MNLDNTSNMRPELSNKYFCYNKDDINRAMSEIENAGKPKEIIATLECVVNLGNALNKYNYNIKVNSTNKVDSYIYAYYG